MCIFCDPEGRQDFLFWNLDEEAKSQDEEKDDFDFDEEAKSQEEKFALISHW